MEAITCIAKLKPAGIADELTEVLIDAKEESRVKACCLALGEIASQEGIAFIVCRALWYQAGAEPALSRMGS